MSATIKVQLKTKIGRPFWRYGKQISPDEWTTVEVTQAQLLALKPQCAPVAAGGVFDIRDVPVAEPPSVFRKTKASSEEPKPKKAK